MKTAVNYQQHAAELLQKFGVKFSTKFLEHGRHFPEDKESRDIFGVTFRRGSSSFSLRFGQSINNSDHAGSTAPTSYDVLAGIIKNDPGTFEDFCGDFGYDTDSRTAERTYKAVVKEWQKVNRFFTSEEIEQLQEIA